VRLRVALAIGCCIPLPATAANYTAGTQAQPQADIALANATSDPNPVITLTANISITGAISPSSASPITIDTQGFTLTSAQFSGATQPVSVLGNLVGATGITGGVGDYEPLRQDGCVESLPIATASPFRRERALDSELARQLYLFRDGKCSLAEKKRNEPGRGQRGTYRPEPHRHRGDGTGKLAFAGGLGGALPM